MLWGPWEHRFNEDPDITVETAAGAFAATTPVVTGYFHGVRVSPATASTVYSVSVEDADGFVIYKRVAIVGSFSEVVAPMIARGVLTGRIANATNNEAFTFKLLLSGGGLR